MIKGILLFFTTLVSLTVAVISGLYLFGFLQHIRVKLYCPVNMGSGSDCYDPNWIFIPVGLSTVIAIFMAIISILISILLQPGQRILAAKLMLVTGIIPAFLFALAVKSFVAFFAAITSAILTFLLIMKLINASKVNAL